MKPSILVVGLFILSKVQALKEAAPFELLYLYSAYKAEWMTKPNAADRVIATGCTHKGGGTLAAGFTQEASDAGLAGICAFDEFVRWIGTKAWASYKADVVGLHLNPDPAAIRTKVGKIVKGPLLYQPSRLFPASYPNNPPPNSIPFPEIFQKGLDAMQNARLAASTGTDAVKEFVNGEVVKCQEYLRVIKQVRLKDQAVFILPVIKASAAAIPFGTSITEKTTVIDGIPNSDPTVEVKDLGNYQELDEDATFIAAGSTVTQEQKNALSQFVEAYGSETATSTEAVAKIHKDVIKMMEFSSNVLKSTDLNCKIFPGKRRARRLG